MEVLVAVLVVAVGVLGIAGLQLVTMQTSTGSMMRTQANQFAYNIIDRIRANPGVDYTLDVDDPAPVPANNCENVACTPAQMADFDRAQWLTQLDDLPAGDGGIAMDGGDVVVTVRWDDDNNAGNDLKTFTIATRVLGAGPGGGGGGGGGDGDEDGGVDGGGDGGGDTGP